MARYIAKIVALALLPLVAVAAIVPVDYGLAQVIMGNGATAGTNDGTGTAAEFNNPHSCSFDPSGNLYITEQSACRVRKVPPGPPYTTSTFVGPTTGVCPASGPFTPGPGTSTYVSYPRFSVWLPDGLTMFLVSYNGLNTNLGHRLYKVTSTGDIAVHAGSGSTGYTDGAGTGAKFIWPWYMVVDGSQSPPVLFLTEQHRVRRITSDVSATVTSFAGSTSGVYSFLDDIGDAARFSIPRGIALWQQGNSDLFVADSSNYRIRRVEQSSRAVTTFAGSGSSTPITDGIGTAATFNTLYGLVIDPTQTYLFAVDLRRVRRIELATATVVTMVNAAGSNGWSSNAQSNLATLGTAYGLCFSPLNSHLFVVGTNSVLEVDMVLATTTTTAATTTTTAAPSTTTTTTTTAAPSTTTTTPSTTTTAAPSTTTTTTPAPSTTTTTTAAPSTTTTTTAAPSTTTTTTPAPSTTTTTTAAPSTTTTTTPAPSTTTSTTTTAAPSTTTTTTAAPSTTTTTTAPPSTTTTTTTTTAAASPITTASVPLNEAALGNVSIPANFTLPLTLPSTFSPLSISRAAGHSGYGWATTIAVLSITVASMAF